MVRVGQVNPAPKEQRTVLTIAHVLLMLLTDRVTIAAAAAAAAVRKTVICRIDKLIAKVTAYMRVMATVAAKKTECLGIQLAMVKESFPVHEKQPMTKALTCSLSRVKAGKLYPAPEEQLTVLMIARVQLLSLPKTAMIVAAVKKRVILGVNKVMARAAAQDLASETVAAKKTEVLGIRLAMVKELLPARENPPTIKYLICSL